MIPSLPSFLVEDFSQVPWTLALRLPCQLLDDSPINTSRNKVETAGCTIKTFISLRLDSRHAIFRPRKAPGPTTICFLLVFTTHPAKTQPAWEPWAELNEGAEVVFVSFGVHLGNINTDILDRGGEMFAGQG